MTVTQTLQTSSPQSNQKSGAALMAKHWGPERLVEVTKEPNCSLGISIVGGKVRRFSKFNLKICFVNVTLKLTWEI
jgi:hypothetical protein